MYFHDIIGQETIKERLRNMVNSGKLPHALLLSGAKGVGKLPLALATAQYLCCSHRSDMEPCGECASCLQFAKLEHPDLQLVFPIAADKSRGIQLCDDVVKPFRKAFLDDPYLTIEQWLDSISDGKVGMIYKQESEAIIRKLNLKSYESDYKIVLIWLPEKMNEDCANKLLKILEEPYEHTHFFLVSDTPDAIIGTIRSRTQNLTVPPIDNQSLESAMQAEQLLPSGDGPLFVRLSQGSWSALKTICSQSSRQHLYFEQFAQMMRCSYGPDIKAIRLFTDTVASWNREQQKAFLQKAQQQVRENFISRCANPELNYMQADERQFATRFSTFIHEQNIEQIMSQLELAEAQIEQNVNSKFVFYHLCLELFFSLHKAPTP